MIRDLRGLVLVAVLVTIAAILIAIPQIRFTILNFDFDRGNQDSFLGLSLGLDLQGGTHLVYDIITEDGEAPSAEDVETVRSIVERRVNEFGVSEPVVQVLGNPPDRILIQIPGQSQSSLTIAFERGSATTDDIASFFTEELGKSGVEVVQNEDQTMVVRFDDFDGSEAETWREMAQTTFPTTMRATFAYETIDPPADEQTTEDQSDTATDDSMTSADDAQDDTENTTATPETESSQDATATPETETEPTPTTDDTEEPAENTATPESTTATPDDASEPTPTTSDDTTGTDDTTDTATDDSEDDTPPEPTRIGPETTEVQAAFDAAGFSNITVQEGTDTIVFRQDEAGQFEQVEGIAFEATYEGKLAERTFDDQGDIVPSDVENLTRELVKIGDLYQFTTSGNIIQWTVAGGVQEAKALIGSTAQLEFRERKCGSLTRPADYQGDTWPPDGLSPTEWLLLRCSDPTYFTEQATNISAEDLNDAFPSIQGTPPEPVVTIVFNESGRDAFFEVTGRVGRNRDVLAIYLDNVELVAPTVNTPGGEGIPDGRAIISGGDFTSERVRTLAIQLRSGALPAELELSEERNVDAILGADSLRRSVIAGGIGLILLIIFMISYYKLPGIVASISLIAYTVMLLGIFKLIPVTLTLSGAAAVILSLGFAVDANILISERAKEELRAGRDLLAALNAGFDRAWPSIRDGNISTIITAVVLFWFGDRFSTSIMQGFALTLAIGVLLSMFTAFFASRLMLRFMARTPIGKSSNLFVPVTDQASSEANQGANA